MRLPEKHRRVPILVGSHRLPRGNRRLLGLSRGRFYKIEARARPDQMEPIDKESLKIKEWEHVEIEKVEQLFLDML